MKKQHIFIFCFLAFISLTTCKKSPEDKGLFLANPQGRLTKEKWKVTEVLYNGTYINNILNDSLILGGIETLRLEFVFEPPESGIRSAVMFTYNGDEKFFTTNGPWELENKDKDLFIEIGESIVFLNGNAVHDNKVITHLFESTWSILNLSTSDLKLRNTKGYEISLKSTK